ncbi:MAG: sulfite exporter TauE/SafE family protein [Candidatus Liberibacter ctenarytainae]|uniref:Probable membrane transporter protein n=1 Tax=Candidatus Liberibacter ctenarytainae TaxID=2020335 RepID=A0A937AFX8_9HYPH|nr:sulfite exporter TauE/SafE family protein [Candidatus Liberibacter ctenarytainae]
MEYVFLLVSASFLSGILSGLFGIGSGLIMIPILYKTFRLMEIDDSICMNIAMGTTIAVVAPTSIVSFLEHRRRGMVDMKILKSWSIIIPITTVLTSLMISHAHITFLHKGFAVFCCFVGVAILFKERLHFKKDFPDNFLKYIWGIVTGVLSGVLGVGGGIFSTLLMLCHGRSINQATAISSGVSVLITCPGLIVRIYNGLGVEGTPPMSIGFVNIGAVLIMLPISMILAPLVTKLSYKIEKKYLEVAFSLFMFVTAFVFL